MSIQDQQYYEISDLCVAWGISLNELTKYIERGEIKTCYKAWKVWYQLSSSNDGEIVFDESYLIIADNDDYRESIEFKKNIIRKDLFGTFGGDGRDDNDVHTYDTLPIPVDLDKLIDADKVGDLDRDQQNEYKYCVVRESEKERFEKEVLKLYEQKTFSSDKNIKNANIEEIKGKQKPNLQRIIAGLSLLVVRVQKGSKYGEPDKPNKSAIGKEVLQIFADKDLGTGGLSPSNFNKVLSESLKEALEQ